MWSSALITASYCPLKRFKRVPSEKGAGTVSGRVNSGWLYHEPETCPAA